MGSAISSFNAFETRSAMSAKSSFRRWKGREKRRWDTYDNFHEVVGLPGGFVLPNHFGYVTLRTLDEFKNCNEREED